MGVEDVRLLRVLPARKKKQTKKIDLAGSVTL